MKQQIDKNNQQKAKRNNPGPSNPKTIIANLFGKKKKG
jgi:hypothetical protein